MADTSTLPLTIFELRRYRARPGQRDALVAMFEANFRPAYEAAGATILGSWTVLAEPDMWVWMRAFPDSAARRQALAAFYGGPVWGHLAAACNATIADARDARVLRAINAGALGMPPPLHALRRARAGRTARPWAATVLPAACAPADAEADVLVLASRNTTLLLRRFDNSAHERRFHAALRLPPGTAHWRLHPTACSRLR